MIMEKPLSCRVEFFITSLSITNVSKEEDEFQSFECVNVPCRCKVLYNEVRLRLFFDCVEQVDQGLKRSGVCDCIILCAGESSCFSFLTNEHVDEEGSPRRCRRSINGHIGHFCSWRSYSRS